MKLLFLDTETTGLPKDWKKPPSDFENWPRVVEIGVILNDESGLNPAATDCIIKPDGFEIPEDAAKVHGITTERALAEGKDAPEIFELLYSLMRDADYIVGHNIQFDIKCVSAEFARLGFELAEYKMLCTMNRARKIFPKWPKLGELYKKLHGKDFVDAHRAGSDIAATSECFYTMASMDMFEELGSTPSELANEINVSRETINGSNAQALPNG